MLENVSLLEILTLNLTKPAAPSFRCGVPEEADHGKLDPGNTPTTQTGKGRVLRID